KSELASVRERGTTNAEAYALLLQANGAAKRLTLQSYQTSDTLLREAIALDPDYANAYMLRSHVLCNLFKYERNDQHLNEALRCAQKALTLKPDFPKAKSALATVHQLLGDHVTAESLLIEATADDPDDYYSYYALGQLYSKLQRLESSIDAYTRSVELKPDFLGAHWGRVISSINLGDNARAEQLALEALPRYERALRITPSREGPKMSYAALLEIANKPQKSRAVMEELLTDPQLDPQTLYTATCLYSRLGETEKALDTLARSIERGFYDFALLQRDTDLDPLRGEERFHQLLQQLEQKQHV
ncbi:MAG TPA: tetratricopeptide repeat protein, partial [Candidatus Kapabacteria bacterium]|nr:tetratricopeptide repeat protein [Candidatus Kapabacteria bacterium]